ncbi:SixA phosphatase family protein [Azotobacter beijerinckii]|uniref:Phosphohistidine phosphatase n=1 Tax=Azotobacter beijerinckii TaxID=170623 RepID=A0A1I0WL78_9GAMM|nr:histidine phosphatase family protein [Azotobacter beijerinckii]SFA89127.1 phosphohistidine phosphatase [Azotobacter beijerinckii]
MSHLDAVFDDEPMASLEWPIPREWPLSPNIRTNAMKTLWLVRHAKSSWDDAALADRDRPLADRGWRDVAKMGRRLAQRGVTPDLILSSPTIRALATAEAIARALDYGRKHIVVDDRLYTCQADDLLEVVQALGDQPKSVLLVGHNPELSEFAHLLSSEITYLPTCTVAEFRFATKSWAEVGKIPSERVMLDYPKKKGRGAP